VGKQGGILKGRNLEREEKTPWGHGEGTKREVGKKGSAKSGKGKEKKSMERSTRGVTPPVF